MILGFHTCYSPRCNRLGMAHNSSRLQPRSSAVNLQQVNDRCSAQLPFPLLLYLPIVHVQGDYKLCRGLHKLIASRGGGT